MWWTLGRCLVLVFVVMAVARCNRIIAQSHDAANSDQPKFDVGTISKGAYSNECLGFSFRVPSEWNINMPAGSTGEAKAIQIPGGKLVLLSLQRKQGTEISRVILMADPTRDPSTSAEDFVRSFVHAQVQAEQGKRELIYNVHSASYGGKQFFRADSRRLVGDGYLYFSSMATRFRDYFIGATIMAPSEERLNASADTLSEITFSEDVPRHDCVLGPPTAIVGIMGSVVSTPGGQRRARLPESVTQNLVIHRVEPSYPDDARKTRVQGMVVLKTIISEKGDVEKTTFSSGDSAFENAAIEAVKQWKYKPYLVDGSPIEVETTVTIKFTAPPS